MSQVSSFSSFNSTPAPPPEPSGGGGGGMGMFRNPKVILIGVVGLGLIIFIWLKRRGSSSADSGYPLGQPNLPSGASSGSPLSDPPANTSGGPVIQAFANGIVACDSINGCQYFDHPQGATTPAPTTTTTTPQTTSTQPPITPLQTLTTPPSAPQPIGLPPIVNVPPPVSPIPPTIAHPLPPPAFSPGGAVLPVGSQQLANQLNNATQSALNSVFAQPPAAKPPPASTGLPLHIAPAPAPKPAPVPPPKPAPRPAPPPLRTPTNAPRPV